MNGKTTIAFLVQRIGPYHHARLRALAAGPALAVTAIEYRPDDRVYAWAAVEEPGGYARHRTRSMPELLRALQELRPGAIVCVGYADPEINGVAAWSIRRGLPLVVCSDSTFDDEPRSWVKEGVKRRVVSAFGAALVSGRRAHDYLAGLGLREEFRFQPWDVVDNDYFARGADLARADGQPAREKWGMPANYFLCVARFVAKKNLRRLVEGFAVYARDAGDAAWSLVLAGSGPLEPELRAAAAAGVGARVLFPGFLPYSALPAWYGLAGAAVLPSLSDQWGLVVNEAMAAGLPVLVSQRCGCAPDLVRAGENGFTFDPENGAELAADLAGLAALAPDRRAAMGRRSRELIAAFSPAAFARGVEAAVACALRPRRSGISWRTRLLVGALARRPIPVES